MAFVVEDDTGLVNANAYITVQEYKDYWKDRGVSITTGATTIQGNIVLATDYVDNNFRWKGQIEFPDTPQALMWPRLNVVDCKGLDVEGVPQNLKNAIAEYTFRSIAGDLQPDPLYQDTNQPVKRTLEEVGPIKEEIEYFGSGQVTLRKYPAADKYLRCYILSGNSVCRG